MAGNARLYKYLDVIGGLAMLHYSNLQFTNATCLNDPFDCHPSLFDFSNAPVNEYNWPPVDFLKKKGITDMENYRNSCWICSLSKVYNSLLMWSYYGNHKGVCIGIDMEKANKYLSRIPCAMTFGAIEYEVQYKNIIEKPDYFHDIQDFYRYQLSTKAKEWEHEHEVRLVLEDPSPRVMALTYKPQKNEVIDWREVRAYPHLGGECFESLYLGIKVGNKEKERIIKEARKCNPNIKIYQMTVDPEAFRLREQLI